MMQSDYKRSTQDNLFAWWNMRFIGHHTRGEILLYAVTAVAVILVFNELLNNRVWG